MAIEGILELAQIVRSMKGLFCDTCKVLRIAFLILLIFPTLASPQKVTEVSSGSNYVEFVV